MFVACSSAFSCSDLVPPRFRPRNRLSSDTMDLFGASTAPLATCGDTFVFPRMNVSTMIGRVCDVRPFLLRGAPNRKHSLHVPFNLPTSFRNTPHDVVRSIHVYFTMLFKIMDWSYGVLQHCRTRFRRIMTKPTYQPSRAKPSASLYPIVMLSFSFTHSGITYTFFLLELNSVLHYTK